MKRLITNGFVAAALAAAALAGCSTAEQGGSQAETPAAAETAAVSDDQSAAQVLAANKSPDTGDAAFNEAEVKDVKLSGQTVTISAAGTYRLSGTLTGGQVVVTAPDAAVKLILDGVDISNPGGAAIAVTDAKQVTVILADGSQNKLSDASSYADGAEVNAALYSKADLTITGTGSLSVRGNGNDAIASSDGLDVQSGTITVDAVDDGIRGKDYLIISGGTVTVTAGGDGLKADNAEEADSGYVAIGGGSVKVTAKGDGIEAATDLVTTGGEVSVDAGGGSTASQGLKAGVIAVLEKGKLNVKASDDGVHGDAVVRVNGAELAVASGDDGIHAETVLRLDGGVVAITESVEGLEAQDISLSGGDVTVVSSDDGVNAAGDQERGDYSVTVTGGNLTINSGGDGFDSNGVATISGGTVTVHGPVQNNNGALDVNGSFKISGGVLAAAGSAGMAVAPGTDSPQGWVSATLTTAVPAGTTLNIVDTKGAVVATFVTTKTVQNIVFSSAAIQTGQEYKVTSGTSEIATVTAGTAPAGRGGGPGGGGFGGPR